MKTRALLGSCLLLATTSVAVAASAQPGTEDFSTFAFIPNGGQFRSDVAFVARMRADQVFVLADGRIVHALPIAHTATESISAWIVLESLPGAVAAPRGALVGDQRVTWLRSATSTPTSDTRSFSSLEWHDAWPGVDMQLQIVGDRTERVFRVAPGADWKRIALAFDGVRFERYAGGGLTARAGDGVLTLSAPVAFQDTADGRVPVDVRYVVGAQGARVSFDVGTYDEQLPLTIDPVLQATYFGFGGQSRVKALAVDPATGDLIAAGTSLGLSVPGLAGGFQIVHSSNAAFVTRIDAKLRRVIQSTLIGGAQGEEITAVAVHPQTGEIYVAGITGSPGLPGAGGGAAENIGGARNDGFVSRFSSDLRRLLQTTFTNQARLTVHPHGIAISSMTGDVYVAGEGFDPIAAYVLRFNRDLTVQLSRSLLEGSSVSRSFSVALNQTTGDVYLAGATFSRVFPLTAGGVEPTYRGEGGDGEAVFIARFNADLSRHIQSTYLSDVIPYFVNVSQRVTPLVAVHPFSDEVYVAGVSNRTDLPAAGGAQPMYGGGQLDVVVTRLSPDLTQRRAATYFGGTDYEEVHDLAFAPDGAQVYLTGFTRGNLPGTAGGAMPERLSTVSGYVARLSASLSALLQTTYFTSVNPVNGRAVAIHPATGEVYFGGQCLDGIAETAGGLQPFYDGRLTSFGTGCLARFDALLVGGDDFEPDVISFTDQFAVAPGAQVTSAPVRIEGITVPVTATVSNGSFSIEGGQFDATARQVRRGETIRVRHTAAPAAGVATNTVLSVGSRAGTFTSVSATGTDSAPDPLAFAARSPVAMGISVSSDPVVVNGIDTPAIISIANGEYSVDGGAFLSGPGTVNGGQTVVVRHTSADMPATVTATTLTVGGVSAQFRITTDSVDDTVHPISVGDEDNVFPDMEVISEPVVVIGINVPVPISVSGAEWSTDAINFRSGPGAVENFAAIALRRRTGPVGTTVTATLTIGDQSDDWVLAQPLLGDATPDPFSFAAQSDAQPLTYVISNEITVTGINVPVRIDAGIGSFLDPVSGIHLNSGFIANGDRTRIRLLTPSQPGALSLVRVRIGTAESIFEVRNAGADLVPDPFDFVDQSGVAAGTQVISNAVTLSGLVGPVLATVTGCELSINGDVFGTAPVLVSSGMQLRLRMAAPAAAGATATCTLAIGGVVELFRVTTAASSGGGGTGAGGGGGASDCFALLCLALLTLIRPQKRADRRQKPHEGPVLTAAGGLVTNPWTLRGPLLSLAEMPMSSQRFSPDFKGEAVRQVTERGYPIAEASKRPRIFGPGRYKRAQGVRPDRQVQRSDELLEPKHENLKLRAQPRGVPPEG